MRENYHVRMGLIARSHAMSVRILAGGTVVAGLLQFGQWGIIPPLLLVAAGVFYWVFGGHAHQQGRIRRAVVGTVWFFVAAFALSMAV